MKRFLCVLMCILIFAALAGCHGAEAASATAAPAPTSTSTPTLAPTPTPTLAPTPSPAPTPFSMVWMSDTQGCTGMYAAAFTSMMDWTASVYGSEHVVALLHTGDIVEDMNSVRQWENIRGFASVLPKELLCVTACGNHDAGARSENPENYLRYRFDTQVDAAQTYLDGLCRYATLEAGGMKILILSIAYLREAASVEWARGVLASHPDHYGILLAHSYLTRLPGELKGGYTSGGAILRDQLVKPSPNLRMVLSGHVHGSAARSLLCDDDGDGRADREVQQFLLNFQASDQLAAGFLRLLRFDPMMDRIEIMTYSPLNDQHGSRSDPLGASYIIENAGLSAYMAP